MGRFWCPNKAVKAVFEFGSELKTGHPKVAFEAVVTNLVAPKQSSKVGLSLSLRGDLMPLEGSISCRPAPANPHSFAGVTFSIPRFFRLPA